MVVFNFDWILRESLRSKSRGLWSSATCHRIFLATVFVLLFANGQSYASTLACQVNSDNCDLYTCQEQVRQCGPRGYLMNFAKPYCQLFVDRAEKFAPETQKWLRAVRTCLQEEVAEFDSSLSCKDLRKQAIAGHADCYKETRFCDLPIVEKIHVLFYLKRAVFIPPVVRTGLNILWSCAWSPAKEQQSLIATPSENIPIVLPVEDDSKSIINNETETTILGEDEL